MGAEEDAGWAEEPTVCAKNLRFLERFCRSLQVRGEGPL